MHLPLLVVSFLTAVAFASPVAERPHKPKPHPPKNDFVFLVPEFHSAEIFGRGPVEPGKTNKSITFNVTDLHATTVPGATAKTICTSSYVYPPNASYPAGCADQGFSWYFAKWYGIANFTLNIDHSYHDPKVGELPVTYFGEGDKLVNWDTTKGIRFICAASGAVCAADYVNVTNPIVVPITKAIA